jgi:uncharacterized metal-binding protein YceD (DUF177 family)
MAERTKEFNENVPFSFPIKVGHVASNAVTITIEADEKEREGLAKLWNIVGVDGLKADVRLSRWKRDGIRVSGTFRGDLKQMCVASLQPITTLIDDEFTAHFVPETSKLARRDDIQNGEIIIDVDGPDIPDTFTANTIDSGEVVAEYAALVIDPYPRDPQAHIAEKFQASDVEDDKAPSPFAALASIKDELS